MLNKLIKYDFKYLNKIMIPLIIITLGLSCINRIFNELSQFSFIFKILYVTTTIAVILLLITLLFNVFVRNIIRFKNQVYGDESYLTHTLPAKSDDIIKSKIISTVLSILLTIIVILVCLFIEYFSKDSIKIIKTMLIGINDFYNIKPIVLFLIVIIIVISMITWITEMIYSSIILGFRHNDKKIIFSFIHAVIFYFGIEFINLLSLLMITIFNKDMMELFKTSAMNNKIILIIIIFVTVINVLYSIAFYFISTKSINKKLNID